MTMTNVSSTVQVDEPLASQLDAAVETILDDAIAHARKKLDVSRPDLSLDDLINYNPTFLEYFKTGLAVGVAELLSSNDKTVSEIYIHDPDWNPLMTDFNPCRDVTVYMLVRVNSSAALEAYIASLDRILLAHLQEMASPLFAKREFILDIQLISEEDIRLRRGYAVLLNSIHAPALKIWERDA